MSMDRPVIALDSRSFGRGRSWLLPQPQVVRAKLGEDLKLFATTFLAGFVFVSLLLA